MNPNEIIEHFAVVKGTFNEIRDDKGTELLVQTLTKDWIVKGHTKEVLDVFKAVGIEKEFFEKIGFDLDNNKPAQHVYFGIVNERLKAIKDMDLIKRKELVKLFTQVNIIEEIDQEGLSDLAKFILELHIMELESIKNYFSSAINNDFNGVHQILSYHIANNDNLVVSKLMEFINQNASAQIPD
jgi:hypothetical protein